MKSLFKMTFVSLMTTLILTTVSLNAFSQGKSNEEKSAGAEKAKIKKMHNYSVNELENNWGKYMRDANFRALVDEVKKKGFKRIEKNDRTAWGYSGKLLRDSTKEAIEEDVEIGIFDFYKKTASGAQMLTMVWRKTGSEIYKCYMIFPENEQNINTALEKAVEYTVEGNGNIVLAHSFSRCWSNCVFTRFSATNCAVAIGACGGAAAGLVALGLGVTTPVALAIFGTCAGVFCLYPLAVCLAYCF